MFPIKVFAGTSNPQLATRVCTKLDISLGSLKISKFSDGEINVQLGENVRGANVFVVQSTCSPTNDNLMELVLIIDTLRRASANRITAVVPYFGYARQDRRMYFSRVPISAKVVADMLCNVGVDRVMTIDLHAEQIQGFFAVPVDNVYATPVLIEDIQRQNYHNAIVVSPDIGGVVRARAVAKLLKTDLAIIDKRRPEDNIAEVMNIIGDIKGRSCILIDDIVDTANTLCNAASALKQGGADQVVAYCTHPVLSGKAITTIENSQLDAMVVTDSIPLSEKALNGSRIRQLPIGKMLAEVMRRAFNEESISAMFTH